jgi:hypothetical protein
MIRQPFKINGSCIKYPKNTSNFELCAGFDCSTEYFYQTPDKLNTYHNYLVLQDEMVNNVPVSCTENHQYFRNWTRRKIPVKEKDINKPPNNNPMDEYFFKIPEVVFNECPSRDDSIKYTC